MEVVSISVLFLSSLTPQPLCKSQLGRLPVPSHCHPKIPFPRFSQSDLSETHRRSCFPPADDGLPTTTSSTCHSGLSRLPSRCPLRVLGDSCQDLLPLPNSSTPSRLRSSTVSPHQASLGPPVWTLCLSILSGHHLMHFSLPLLESCQAILEVSAGMSAPE